jgi:DNA-binding response OmpR family regulator
MPARVLLIDDDARLHELLQSYLVDHGFAVTTAPDGPRGLAALAASTFDAVLLDLMMPGMDGLEVCRRVRATSRVPIIMLTARGDEADRIVGLELGADDYIAKPFSPRELVARLRAVLRRAGPAPVAERLTVAGLAVEPDARAAWLDGVPLDLTALELDLLIALARRAGRVVTRDALLDLVGRGTTVGERAVDVHISHLRAKLGDDSRAPTRIKTVRGVGYVLARDVAEPEP